MNKLYDSDQTETAALDQGDPVELSLRLLEEAYRRRLDRSTLTDENRSSGMRPSAHKENENADWLIKEGIVRDLGPNSAEDRSMKLIHRAESELFKVGFRPRQVELEWSGWIDRK